MAGIADLRGLEFRAMGCHMGAWVVAASAETARVRLQAVERFMLNVEAALSRFRPDSELCRLNARAGRAVAVGPVLWEVLNRALDAARTSAGLYDPTLLDALEAAGYDRTFEEVRDAAAPVRSLSAARADWREIRLDPVRRMVTLPAGGRIDLGGIAKGWAADRAANLLADLGPCLVDAGGDIAARGNRPDLDGWPVGIADPRDETADLALLVLRDRAVATSGVDHRRWLRGGAVQHHLIDPRTRRPARTDLLTVSAVARDAATADLYAKLGLLLGSRAGHRYLTEQADIEALFVHDDGRRTTTPGFAQYCWAG